MKSMIYKNTELSSLVAFLSLSLLGCTTFANLQDENASPPSNFLNRVEETSFQIGKCVSKLDQEIEQRYGIPPKSDSQRCQNYIARETKIRIETPGVSPLLQSEYVTRTSIEADRQNHLRGATRLLDMSLQHRHNLRIHLRLERAVAKRT